MVTPEEPLAPEAHPLPEESGRNDAVPAASGKRPPRPLWQYLGAATLSAELLTLASPPPDFGWLGWLALIPLFGALLSCAFPSAEVADARPNRWRKTAFWTGFGFGCPFVLFLVPWFAAFTPVGYPIASGYWGLLAGSGSVLLVGLLRRAGPSWAPLLLAAGWTVFEWLRAQGALAFPWGTLAATQHRHLPMIQMLDLTGAYGLTFLMALVSASAAQVLQAFGRLGIQAFRHSGVQAEASSDGLVPTGSPPYRGGVGGGGDHGLVDQPQDSTSPRPLLGKEGSPAGSVAGLVNAGSEYAIRNTQYGPRWLALSVGITLLATARGAFLLAQPETGTPLRVGLVQASRSIQVPGAAVQCVSPPEEYDRRTVHAIDQGAELVVWPETARPADVVHDFYTREGVERLVRGTKAHLLAGSFVLDPPSDRDTNAAVMFSPQGEIRGQYAKVSIVPFGEYLPARPLFFFAERVGWPIPSEDLQAGPGWKPIPWDRGSVGVSICFESAFGFISREHVRQGANLLAVMTSDGWAGRSAAGLQHAAFAPLRAVETRRSIARAAATGVSELIDPNGRVLRSLPMFQEGIVVGEVPLRTGLTLYTHLGDWPVALSWLLLLAGFFIPRFRSKQSL